jgi:hypothetical protein
MVKTEFALHQTPKTQRSCSSKIIYIYMGVNVINNIKDKIGMPLNKELTIQISLVQAHVKPLRLRFFSCIFQKSLNTSLSKHVSSSVSYRQKISFFGVRFYFHYLYI